jgi:glycosyltransferase involved in cell wall biosynthesis
MKRLERRVGGEGRLSLLLLSHVPDDPNGGASRVYHLLAASLRDRGHQVDLHHVDTMGLPRNPRLNLLAKRLALPHYVSRHGMAMAPYSHDIVMASSGMAAPLFQILKGRSRRPLLVNHIHGLTVYDHMAALDESRLGHGQATIPNRAVTGPFQIRWDKAGVDSADLTIVQNTRDLSEVRSRVRDEDRVALVPAAVHPELLAANWQCQSLSQRKPDSLIWFGTWEARKGAWYVPAAFRLLRRQHPGASLIVGGTGRTADEILIHFAPEDRDHVRVLPRISIEQQVHELGSAAIFLFPSLSEGFGLALVEAMCCGAAAVTTSTAFGGDYLSDGVNARVVPATAEHIGRALIELVTDGETRRRIAAAGRELAQTFTAQQQAAAYEHLLASHVSERNQMRSSNDA